MMRRRGGRAVLFPVLLLLAALLPEVARSDSLYTISGLEIAAEAEDAVAAKEKALSEGMREALQTVISRIAVGRAPEVDADAAYRLAAAFSFERETIGRTSYAASLNVRFDAADIQRYLTTRGAGFVDHVAPAVLAVPVLMREGYPLLWEEASAWHEALAALSPEAGIAPVLLPAGDRSDHEMDPGHLLGLEHLETTRLRLRYGAHGVLLAIAEPQGENVRLVLKGEDAAGPVDTAIEVEGGLAAAAQRVVDTVKDRWKRTMGGERVAAPSVGLRGTVDYSPRFPEAPEFREPPEFRDPPGFEAAPGFQQSPDLRASPRFRAASRAPALQVLVILRRNEDWAFISRALQASSGVDGVSLDRAEPGMVEATIWARGDPQRLADALARQGVDLFPAGGRWVMQRY